MTRQISRLRTWCLGLLHTAQYGCSRRESRSPLPTPLTFMSVGKANHLCRRGCFSRQIARVLTATRALVSIRQTRRRGECILHGHTVQECLCRCATICHLQNLQINVRVNKQDLRAKWPRALDLRRRETLALSPCFIMSVSTYYSRKNSIGFTL